MNFYDQYVLPYAEKIEKYFYSDDFFNAFARINGKYFTERYFKDFLNLICGGKCIRAYICNLFYRAFGGTNEGENLIFSAAFELYESSVLMHDDIIDRSPLRRGKPSAFVALGGGHAGLSRALCFGDIGILTAASLAETALLPDFYDKNRDLNDYSSVLHAASILKKIFLTTVSGELKDVDLSYEERFDVSDVLETYREKTAYYTVSGPAVTGAVLAGANEEIIANISELAINLGIAFQIKDDILGIFSNSEQIGKSNVTDITEGKKSLLLAYYKNAASENEKREFFKIYGANTITDKDAEYVKNAFKASGALDKTEKDMENYFLKARNYVASLPVADKFKKETEQLIEFLRNRKK